MTDFRTPWAKSEPFLVKNNKVSESLWSPNEFLKIAAHNVPTIYDCESRKKCKVTTPELFLGKFKNYVARPINPKKIADWPANESFRTVFPDQYANFMDNLAFSEYTHPNGVFNLVSYLPKFLCNIPDLGPKLYIADGSLDSGITSTHLHKDMSDAINTCKWVEFPINGEHVTEQALRDEYLVCQAQIDRFNKNKEKLAAVWHIFKANHYDKINRYLLGKNRGTIHDQSAYLTHKDFKEFRIEQVRPYTILQFEGDTIHLPAGLPHQVMKFC